jgi:uncharacterized protein (TIGR03000 family)
MLRRGIAILGVLALGGAVVLLTPNISQAQRRGGGGREGNWSGGREGWSGNREGWSGREGWGWGGWGGRGYYGYFPWNYGGYGNSWYYPGYSNWTYPGYYSYGDNFGSYRYPTYGYGDNFNYYGNDHYDTNQGYSFQPNMTGGNYPYGMEGQGRFPQDANTVHLTVRVPPDAQITVEGYRTQSRGPVRDFVSPPLTPDRDYTYDIQAKWMQDGKEVTREKHVNVRAGAMVPVDFVGEQGSRQLMTDEGARERQYGAPRDREGNIQQRDTFQNRDLNPDSFPTDQRTTPANRGNLPRDQQAVPSDRGNLPSEQQTKPTNRANDQEKPPPGDKTTNPTKSGSNTSGERPPN